MVVDRFSKAVYFIPLPKLPSARETAQLMVDHVLRLHGLPVDGVSDRGPQFASRFWKEFCRQIGASASLSSGFHPQTNGQCERANEDLERMLRCLTSNNPSSWCQQLSWIEYAHNSLPVAASGVSPFECSVGYIPPLFPSQEPEAAVPSALAFVQRCRRTWDFVEDFAPNRWTNQGSSRSSPVVPSNLCVRSTSMAFYQGSASPVAFSQAGAQIHWAIPRHQGGQSGGDQAQAPPPLLAGFTLCFTSQGSNPCFLLPSTLPAIAPPPHPLVL